MALHSKVFTDATSDFVPKISESHCTQDKILAKRKTWELRLVMLSQHVPSFVEFCWCSDSDKACSAGFARNVMTNPHHQVSPNKHQRLDWFDPSLPGSKLTAAATAGLKLFNPGVEKVKP